MAGGGGALSFYATHRRGGVSDLPRGGGVGRGKRSAGGVPPRGGGGGTTTVIGFVAPDSLYQLLVLACGIRVLEVGWGGPQYRQLGGALVDRQPEPCAVAPRLCPCRSVK